MKDSEHKDISDPTYSAADFWVQLSGGRLRWLATLATVAGAGLFIDLLTEGEKAELFFPVHITGQTTLWVVGVASAICAMIAIVNWRSWLKKKRDAA
jgi:hypothetical protein